MTQPTAHTTEPLRCTKCRREVRPWPLSHPSCAPGYWVYCITTNDQRWR